MGRQYKSIITMLAFLMVFAFGGFLHVYFYGVDGATSLYQLYYCIVELLWGISVQRRIIDRRSRRLFFFIVILLVLFYILQAGRFAMFNYAPVTERYLWYGYYIVYTIVPCLFFMVADGINHEGEKRVRPICIIVYVISVLECGLVLTNDLHQIVFIFPGGVANAPDTYEYGGIYYLVVATEMILYLASMIIIFFKCRIKSCRRMIWMPMIFTVIGCTETVLSFVSHMTRINGVTVWSHSEVYSFLVMGNIESCISMGLISSNTYYNKFFALVKDPVLIKDKEKIIRFATISAKDGIEASDDMRVYTKSISGGVVSYGVDISELNRLNTELEEATERVKIRNEYLENQNDLKEEQLKLQTRNDIYDNIAQIVKPRLDKTLELSENKDDFEDTLAKIAFYNAYIKRRSNMELIRAESDSLSIKELSTAVNESVEYLKLSNIKGTALITGNKKYPVETIILLYEFFQYVTETYLDTLSEIYVTTRRAAGSLSLVINLGMQPSKGLIDTDWKKEELLARGGYITLLEEPEETTASILVKEGGDGNDDIR